LCGEDHDRETHLIPVVLQAASKMRSVVEVYGNDYPTADGTCVRDYIHVRDLARAHILALGRTASSSGAYNLGCGGEGYSVRQVIDTARLVTGRDFPVKYGRRRPGDPAVLIASSERIQRELGWTPRLQDLGSIISSAWEWMKRHPGGYREPPVAKLTT
jgi:UDP-glucose 4-epimerase